MINDPAPTTKNKSKYILGAVLFAMLMAGLIATYWLTKQNQDIRQQASETEYEECTSIWDCKEGQDCYHGYCIGEPTDTCTSDTHYLLYDECVPRVCRDVDGDGVVVCGYTTDDDVCTTASHGGDWCVDQNGVAVPCADLGMIRCLCAGDYDTGWWVIGMADSCNQLCDEAEIDCDDCPPSSPRPSTPPPSSPSPTPGVSPSPTPSVSPSPSPGPQCLSIVMDNPAAELGDQTTFTCGNVAGVDHYVFRVVDPSGVISNLDATGQVSAPYTIDQNGMYSAQCQICTGTDESTCHAWEPLP